MPSGLMIKVHVVHQVPNIRNMVLFDEARPYGQSDVFFRNIPINQC